MSVQDQCVPLVEIRRGEILEAMHLGALAVVDAAGEAVYTAGDDTQVFVLRSSAKPIQTLASLLAGTVEALALTDEELAAACASHSGEQRHVAAARSILAKAGIEESALLCGEHEPFTATAKSPDWGVLNNNCSGKHALMLATCKRNGWPLPSYQAPDHPLQLEIRRILADMARIPEEEIRWGVDGCGVPAWAVSLRAAATAFARVADPRELDDPLPAACARVCDAMTGHPGMVGGVDRLDTELMEAGGGRFWAKVGAEGFYAVGIRPQDGHRGLGLAVKILDGDGSSRARAAVATDLLEKFGALSSEEARRIREKHAPPVVRNNRGLEAGTLETRLP